MPWLQREQGMNVCHCNRRLGTTLSKDGQRSRAGRPRPTGVIMRITRSLTLGMAVLFALAAPIGAQDNKAPEKPAKPGAAPATPATPATPAAPKKG